MANKIANEEDDSALQNVDYAIDSIVAGLIAMEENLPDVKTENMAQRAALDNVESLLNEALMPYMGDIVKLMHEAFGE